MKLSKHRLCTMLHSISGFEFDDKWGDESILCMLQQAEFSMPFYGNGMHICYDTHRLLADLHSSKSVFRDLLMDHKDEGVIISDSIIKGKDGLFLACYTDNEGLWREWVSSLYNKTVYSVCKSGKTIIASPIGAFHPKWRVR
jgi:hypothetical protein